MKHSLLSAALLVSGVLWAGTNTWTSLGPDGGNVGFLAVDPRDSTVYAYTSGGVFKSVDGAASWSTTGPGPAGEGVLAIDPQIPGTLYAMAFIGDGMFKSTDGGNTWSALHAHLGHVPVDAPKLSFTIDPQNSNTLYVTSYNGVFKSIDGGAGWKEVNSGLPGSPIPTTGAIYVPVLSLAVDPTNSLTLYVTIGGPGVLFKSTDGGASWTAANSGLPLTGCPIYPWPLLVDPQDPATLHLGYCGNLFKSTDGGASWGAIWNVSLRQFSPIALVIDPKNSNILYAAASGCFPVFKSTDGGATWAWHTSSGSPARQPRTLALDPRQPNTLYAGYNASIFQPAVYMTTDGAANWAAASAVRAIGVSAVMVDPKDPATLYASITPSYALLKSTDAGASWKQLDSVYSLLAVDPQNSGALYGFIGGHFSKSVDAGATWQPADAGLPDGGGCLRSLVFDPQNSATLYGGYGSGDNDDEFCGPSRNDGVWRSNDAGASWARLDSQPGGSGIHGLAIDPQNSKTIYAWNDSGLFGTSDGGATWNALSPLNISSLVIDPQISATLYASGMGVIKSVDGGVNWSPANAGLPTFPNSDDGSNHYSVTSLVIDSRDRSTLYAATLSGVFRTRDGGASWREVNSGLTAFSISGLTIDPQNTSTVYAGTSGGVFVITFVP